MTKHYHVLASLILISLLFTSCGDLVPTRTGQVDTLETVVAATLTANIPVATPTQPQAVTPTSQPATSTPTKAPTSTNTPLPTPTPPENNTSGKICFPGGDIPAMNLYLEVTPNKVLVKVPITAGQNTYETSLVPGTYIAYAWLTDFSRGGSYSLAVTCGMKSNCTDHTLQKFTITEGEKLTGIDVCDWYGGPFAVPYPPDLKESEVTGQISGHIVFPGGNPPAMHVVFFNVTTKSWIWIGLLGGQTTYISPDSPGLAPGIYHVVAYADDGKVGGYADTNHNLIEVTVKAGETIPDVDIADWNAPEGSFPQDPTR